MAVIRNIEFIKHVDRLGKQYKILKQVETDVDAGGTRHTDNIIDSADNLDAVESKSGYDVVNDMATSMKTTDDDFVSDAKVVKPLVQTAVSSLESHVIHLGASSLNAFLATSGIQVPQSYADAYKAVKNVSLNAVGVYAERNIALGHLAITSSGVGTYTQDLIVGTGAGTYVTAPDSSINYAPTFVEVHVKSGVGANNILLQLNLQDENLTSANYNLTIPNGTAAGTVIQVTNSGRRFYKLNATASHFAGGAASDGIYIIGRILRSIGL